MTADWWISPRDANLGRTADPLSGWESLTLVERHNSPDTWTVSGPAASLAVFSPGMGCILDRDGEQITSGRVTGINRTFSVEDGGRSADKLTVRFASDLASLSRIVFPTPGHVLGPTVSTFPAAHDLRSGTVEDLILGFVSSNEGPLAQVNRRLARLRLPTSQGRGGSTQVTGRFDNLGVLVQSLAEAGGLRVRIVHAEDAGGAWLDLVIEQVADLSLNVRFGTADSTATGLITAFEYDLAAPTTTRAIVAAGEEGAAREVLQIVDTASEALWGTVAETLVDQRQVASTSADKLAELTRAGQEALTEGKAPTSVTFTPTLGPDLEYRRDVRVGDIVGYDLPGLDPAEEKIREATTTVQVQSGQATERVEVVVGTPDAAMSRDQRQTARALRDINVIKRSL